MGKVDEYIELGTAFLEGDGVVKDYERAFYWLSAARELGSDKAESMLREMRSMSLGTPFEGDVTGFGIDALATNELSDPSSDGWAVDARVGATRNSSSRAKYFARPGRCIACGMEALVPSTSLAGAMYCSLDKGGCGTTVMIPIVENGLDRGLALQPYRERIPGRRGSTYSSLGALVHMIKYDARVGDTLKADMVAEIASRVRACDVIRQLTGGARRDLVIVPAPSSKKRKVQPVYLLAQFMSEEGYGFEAALTKRSSVESKSRPRGTELAPGDVRCSEGVSDKVVLLVDDTYGEGATLRACIRALREKGAREVYFLSLCKNIFGGMKGSPTDDNDIH